MEDFSFASLELEIQNLIANALGKAIRADGSSRLLGRSQGLFPGGNTKSRAVRFCLEADPPLLLREEPANRKRPLYVRLSTRGLEHLVEFTHAAKRTELIR